MIEPNVARRARKRQKKLAPGRKQDKAGSRPVAQSQPARWLRRLAASIERQAEMVLENLHRPQRFF